MNINDFFAVYANQNRILCFVFSDFYRLSLGKLKALPDNTIIVYLGTEYKKIDNRMELIK